MVEYNELDQIYDRAFPVREPGDLADILDTPWPTVRRTMQLLPGRHRTAASGRPVPPFVAEAVAAGDAALLRLLVVSPVGESPARGGRAGARRPVRAGRARRQGRRARPARRARTSATPSSGAHRAKRTRARRRPPARAWSRTSSTSCCGGLPAPAGLTAASRLPEALKPRGLRFVLRALAWPKAHPLAAAGSRRADRRNALNSAATCAAGPRRNNCARSGCACPPATRTRCCGARAGGRRAAAGPAQDLDSRKEA